MLSYVVACFITAVATLVTYSLINRKQNKKKSVEAILKDDATFHHAFDAGWRAAISDPTTVKKAYEDIFIRPLEDR